MLIKNKRVNKKLGVKGFTLVELVISLVIFSILCIGVGSTMLAGFQIWDRAKNGMWKHQHILLSIEAVARDVRQSMAVQDVIFTGTHDSVMFCSIRGNDLVKVKYMFDREMKSLVQSDSFLKDIRKGKEDYRTSLIVDNLDQFEISYLSYSNDQKESVVSWVEKWLEKPFPPYAVRFHIRQGDWEYDKVIFIPSVYREMYL